MLCVIATPRPEALADFIQGLGQAGTVITARTGMGALETAKARGPQLVVIDQGLPDFAPFHLVHEIIRVNAMINTAVLTGMSPEEFHEQGEGLGILTGLPLKSGKAEAKELLALAGGVL